MRGKAGRDGSAHLEDFRVLPYLRAFLVVVLSVDEDGVDVVNEFLDGRVVPVL